jgi:3-deoxy-D-manno-octulosonic-acid transferase
VLTGPHVDNFPGVCELLITAGACLQVKNATELRDTVQRWLQDAGERHRIGEQGRTAVEQNRGALTTVLGMIDNCLAAGDEKNKGDM